MTSQLLECAARERADRIERHVAEQLDPDLLTDARRDRALEACANEDVRDAPASLRSAAVRLAEADSISFDVTDDAGLDDVGGEIGEGPHDPAWFDRARDDPAWIDPLEANAIELAAVPL